MGVHLGGALQEAAPHIGAERDLERQTDRRPDRVAATDTLIHREYPIFGGAPGLRLVRRGRYRGEVVVGFGLAQLFHQPLTAELGVGSGLWRLKGFGDDKHERRLRVEACGLLGEVFRVDVGDEADLRAT